VVLFLPQHKEIF
jgi:hypothetical protein